MSGHTLQPRTTCSTHLQKSGPGPTGNWRPPGTVTGSVEMSLENDGGVNRRPVHFAVTATGPNRTTRRSLTNSSET